MQRRDFLRSAALAAAAFGVPIARAEQAFSMEAPQMPSEGLFASDPEKYWTELRRQWLLASDRINLNCGSVGCTPLPVLRATIEHMLAAEEFREPGYPWFGYEENTRIHELRDAMAAFLHIGRDELAILRNATEANNVVCNGLEMKSGEEAILTDQEHPGCRGCWEQKAARYGIKVVNVALPTPPDSPEEVVSIFERAITQQTRILVFSHITSPTGIILPVKQICAMARAKGVLTHIDGAHAVGQIPLDLHDLGCDFYASSPHKWLMAPKGTGLLYVREELLEKLWVNTCSGSWHDYTLKAYRFENLGTSNLSVMVGLKAALDFYRTIGAERIYARIHQQAQKVRETVLSHPEIRTANASREDFYGGLVSFFNTKGDLAKVAGECDKRAIRTGYGSPRMRIASHIFTQTKEIETFSEAVAAGLRA
jgi:selenocysteine lyase/cysteine desulfurase